MGARWQIEGRDYSGRWMQVYVNAANNVER
jgi:hypothetical protein